jgi:hypothetical protein
MLIDEQNMCFLRIIGVYVTPAPRKWCWCRGFAFGNCSRLALLLLLAWLD